MQRDRLKTLTCTMAATACLGLLLLSGCGAQTHQIIDSQGECSSCHSSDKDTYEVTAPKGATEVSTSFAVKTSADSVVLCTPVFVSEDGSTCVPVKGKSTRVSDGEAKIEADEGVYVIAIDKDSSSTYKIIKVSADSNNTSIDL